MDESKIVTFVNGSLDKNGWLVLPEFGINSYGYFKIIDLAAFKWKNNREIQAVAYECKCKETARESFLASLAQAVEYQRFFSEVFICTQFGDYQDLDSILRKLGIGYIMVDEKGEIEIVTKPSVNENDLYKTSLFDNQVRNRAILLLVFNELFPESYKKKYFGGTKQGELWIYNKSKGSVQFRAWTDIDSDSYFGINIEAVHLIKNIIRNMDIDQLLTIFSKLPLEYTVYLFERTTIETKDGQRILDRQKGSISIEDSIFEKEEIPACTLTKEQIQEEIIDRSKKLDYYSQLLLDKKIWNLKSDFTKEQYLKKIINTKETLEDIYNLFTKWSM